MLKSFDVFTSGGKYRVNIGKDIIKNIEKGYNEIYLVDEYFTEWISTSDKIYITIPSKESSKDLSNISGIIEKMRESGANRQTHVYAIGGGIIQDIATFINSIYMRGIKWTYFPTTLLSMVDSCIGGKSSINVNQYKNIVGNIYPPNEIYIDVNYCKTLMNTEIIGGLAEAVKICFAKGPQEFYKFIELNQNYPLKNGSLIEMILLTLTSKKWFIEIDEFDKSERLLLNYGHTFGHSLEAASNYSIPHGVAVALGMLIANRYAENEIVTNINGKEKIQILDRYLLNLLSPIISELRVILNKLDLRLVLNKFENDKKHEKNSYSIIIPGVNGGLELISLNKNDNTRNKIIKAFKKIYI